MENKRYKEIEISLKSKSEEESKYFNKQALEKD